MRSGFVTYLLTGMTLATTAFAGVAEENVQYSATHVRHVDSSGLICDEANPMTYRDSQLSVDWTRMALQVAASVAVSRLGATAGNVAPPLRPALKCD